MNARESTEPDRRCALLHSQKCQYALRAVFELARRSDHGPIRIADVAEAQAIPVRFLENILNELKKGGFVQSVRGRSGGYVLARTPDEITVGEIIRFVQGPIVPVHCMFAEHHGDCPLEGDCPYLPMWERAEEALKSVYDTTTFADLLADERRRRGRKKKAPRRA